MFRNFFYDFVKITGLPALVFIGPHVRFSGPEAKKALKHGGILFVSNHVSFTDPVTVMASCLLRRPVFMATKDLYRKWYFSFFFSHVGCIKVDKENFSVDTFHSTVDALKSGKIVCMFPEGSVHAGEDVFLNFRDGAVLMAWRAGVRIVPAYISVKKHWYSHPYIIIGNPVDVSFAGSKFPDPVRVSAITADIQHRVENLASQFKSGTYRNK